MVGLIVLVLVDVVLVALGEEMAGGVVAGVVEELFGEVGMVNGFDRIQIGFDTTPRIQTQ